MIAGRLNVCVIFDAVKVSTPVSLIIFIDARYLSIRPAVIWSSRTCRSAEGGHPLSRTASALVFSTSSSSWKGVSLPASILKSWVSPPMQTAASCRGFQIARIGSVTDQQCFREGRFSHNMLQALSRVTGPFQLCGKILGGKVQLLA